MSALTHCLVCRSTALAAHLSLGQMPLANAFPRGPEDFALEARYELATQRCEHCGHVQLTESVSPQTLFDSYIYLTGTSSIATRWASTIAERTGPTLAQEDLVLELASNDGTLLAAFRGRCRTLGVEPAQNVAALAEARGLATIAEYFDGTLAGRILREHGPARLIIARNVLAHVPDPVGFLTAARRCLTDDGLVWVEVPSLAAMVDELQFDQIYHEHLSYFSLRSLVRLFAAAGLTVVDAELIPLHGGSLLVQARIRGPKSPRVDALLASEASAVAPEALAQFVAEVERQREAIPRRIRKLGAPIAAYGAAAKGVVVMNACGLDASAISWVADKNPSKQGRFIPGVHVPVVPPEAVLREQPRHLAVLAWNVFPEIAHELAAYEKAGGKFVRLIQPSAGGRT